MSEGGCKDDGGKNGKDTFVMSTHHSPVDIATLAEEVLENNTNIRSATGFRTLVAFWILGLCNNYGYVVMLSAAHDILSEDFNKGNSEEKAFDEIKSSNGTSRQCNTISTGAILLADIIPSLLTKMIMPFFPLCIHVRLFLIVILSVAGYILVGVSVHPWMAILGVICTAFSSGLGEVSLLAYMAFFRDKNVISAWSSGTGGAGFFGSLTYAGLTGLGLTPSMTLYILTSVPALMALTFWFILQHPNLNAPVYHVNNDSDPDLAESSQTVRKYSEEVPLHTTDDSLLVKLKYVPSLAKYMIPIGLVYFFEYFINQGLFELIYYDNIWLTHKEQYRWYQVLYQIGVFISRSSINIMQVDHLWVLGLLQGLNVIFFTVEAVIYFIPSIIIVMAAVLWEGLLGGAAYVNTFHKINVEVSPNKREFSMAITSLADAFGISLAGLIAIPIHNYICQLPRYDLLH